MTGVGIVAAMPGSGPVIGPIHTAGADDYIHRFVAARVNQNPDTAISTLLDLGSAQVDLSAVAHTAQSVILRQASGQNYVEVVSSTGTTGDYAMSAAGGATDYQAAMTIAVVARFPSAAVNGPVRVFGAHTLSMSRTSDSGSQARVQARRTGASGQALGNVSKDVWLLLLATVDGAQAAIMRVTNTETTATLTSPTGAAAETVALGGNQSASNGQVHIREAIAWQRVLSSAERQAVYDSLKAHYTDLT